jgi:hypothetical protein
MFKWSHLIYLVTPLLIFVAAFIAWRKRKNDPYKDLSEEERAEREHDHFCDNAW